MIKILIDRSTIRRNPNAGRTFILVPGRGSAGTRQIQYMHTLEPEPSFFFEYVPTDVQCSSCKATFDHTLLESDCVSSWDMDIDDYTYSDTVCPKCKTWNCCEIEFEEFDTTIIKKKEVPMPLYKVTTRIEVNEKRLDEVVETISCFGCPLRMGCSIAYRRKLDYDKCKKQVLAYLTRSEE